MELEACTLHTGKISKHVSIPPTSAESNQNAKRRVAGIETASTVTAVNATGEAAAPNGMTMPPNLWVNDFSCAPVGRTL